MIDFSSYTRSFLEKLERELISNPDSDTVKQFMRDFKIINLEALREALYVELRTIPRDILAPLTNSVLSGYSRFADKTEADLLSLIRGYFDGSGPKTQKDLQLSIQDRLNVVDWLSRTLAWTGAGAVNRANRISESLKGGLTNFRYIGPEPERRFCKTHLGEVYSYEEILKLDNGQKLPPLLFAGGYNCQHDWQPVEIAKPGLPLKPVPKPKPVATSDPLKPVKDDLTDNQSKAKDEIAKIYGVKDLPESFFRDDFDKEVKLSTYTGKQGAYYHVGNETIHIDISNSIYKNPNRLKKTIVHECTHHRHFIQDLIKDNSIEPGLKKALDEQKKEFLALAKKNPDLVKKTFNDLWSVIVPKELKQDFPNLSDEDITNYLRATADYVGGLTKNTYGYGHNKSYMRSGNNAAMEWFAHCAENYYLGNPVFEKLLPDLYTKTKDMMRTYAAKR